LTGEGLCAAGYGSVWTEMPSDGTRRACSSFSLLDSTSAPGERDEGDVIRFIDGQSS
jgi:hypothetical protein